MNTAACEKEAPSLSRDEAIAILDTPDEELEALIDRASSLRYKYKGNRVSIHILTNARSGNCSQDCAYCAQSCRSTADMQDSPMRSNLRKHPYGHMTCHTHLQHFITYPNQ